MFGWSAPESEDRDGSQPINDNMANNYSDEETESAGLGTPCFGG